MSHQISVSSEGLLAETVRSMVTWPSPEAEGCAGANTALNRGSAFVQKFLRPSKKAAAFRKSMQP